MHKKNLTQIKDINLEFQRNEDLRRVIRLNQ